MELWLIIPADYLEGRCAMLNDFSWNMTGYIPKHQVNPHGDGIIPYVAERIFQLEPEPPAVDSLNEYILSALREKNLLYFSFFLHHYETQLNKRIKGFLSVDGGNLYDTDRFIDIKISCREQMLQKLMDYDPAKGAEYATYIYPFIWDSMLRFRMGEEKWSVSSLTNYKMVRSMAWLYHNTKDAVNQFSKKYNCDLALAEEYLKVVRGIRNQQPFYITDEDGEETGEDIALDDSWNYTDILWNGIQAEKVQRAFEKLNYREQTLLEKRLAICMTCGRVGSWKNRPTFEELAIMFEGSTASGAERAYRKAVDKLTELLVAEGALHAVRLKQKTKTKRKKKIAAAIYEYQAVHGKGGIQILLHEEEHGGCRNAGNDQRDEAVFQPHLGDQLQKAQCGHLCGHGHDEQNQSKGGLFELEVIGVDAIGRQCREVNAERCRAGRHQQAVADAAYHRDVGVRKHVAEVCDDGLARHQREALLDLEVGAGGVDDQHIEEEQAQKADQHQHQIAPRTAGGQDRLFGLVFRRMCHTYFPPLAAAFLAAFSSLR